MTEAKTIFDIELDRFKETMQWSPQATDLEKTLVLGNLNGFVGHLNRRLHGGGLKFREPTNRPLIGS